MNPYKKIKNLLYIKKQENLRGSNDLFRSGEVFNASDKELENIIKEISSRAVPNPLVRHREIIRALVVNNIQSQRFIKSIENRNFVLTVIIIVLTLFSIYLARIQVSPILQDQQRNEQQAFDFCKVNPSLGWPMATGGEITCNEVLKMLDGKFK
ncbi:MAG: hypothetical protein AAB504_00280 [Patescibacteria group bacterium]